MVVTSRGRAKRLQRYQDGATPSCKVFSDVPRPLLAYIDAAVKKEKHEWDNSELRTGTRPSRSRWVVTALYLRWLQESSESLPVETSPGEPSSTSTTIP